jgi:hypothetical protein
VAGMFLKYYIRSYTRYAVLIYFSSSGVVDKKCIKALKVHLNHKSNLKMLDKDSNQNASCFLFRFHDKYLYDLHRFQKNHVVAALNEHADPAQFHPKVKKHIVDHDRDILRTAAAIDNEFNGKGGVSTEVSSSSSCRHL